MSKTITQIVMGAMGCDRRAHYGNVEQPFCGEHGHYGQWPCPAAAVVAAALTAAGFGDVREAGAKAWDAAVNEAHRRWQIGHMSASILRQDNPYREGTK